MPEPGGVFFPALIFLFMAAWELAFPRRPLSVGRPKRWLVNLSMIALGRGLLLLAFPGAALLAAAAARAGGWGLLPRLPVRGSLEFVIGILVLDLAVYLQHLMFHAVPLLWRLHMVHHADIDVDATTGLRFHPLELLLSLGIKSAAAALAAPPPASVLVFEILLTGTSLFNHGNVFIPERMDRILRFFVVTPDMHRVHHSVAIRETNSNFGFNFPWWDRLFGTYRAQPAAGHLRMAIGLAQYRAHLGLGRALLLPVVGDPGSYPLGRSGGDPRRL